MVNGSIKPAFEEDRSCSSTACRFDGGKRVVPTIISEESSSFPFPSPTSVYHRRSRILCSESGRVSSSFERPNSRTSSIEDASRSIRSISSASATYVHPHMSSIRSIRSIASDRRDCSERSSTDHLPLFPSTTPVHRRSPFLNRCSQSSLTPVPDYNVATSDLPQTPHRLPRELEARTDRRCPLRQLRSSPAIDLTPAMGRRSAYSYVHEAAPAFEYHRRCPKQIREFDMNDYPQLTGRPTSSGGPQGQSGSLRKQGINSIVQQNQEFSIQNEDFAALPGFKSGNSDFSLDFHQKEQLHENVSMLQSQHFPMARPDGFNLGDLFSSSNGSYQSHVQPNGLPSIGCRPSSSPSRPSSIGSYDQNFQQYEHQLQKKPLRYPSSRKLEFPQDISHKLLHEQRPFDKNGQERQPNKLTEEMVECQRKWDHDLDQIGGLPWRSISSTTSVDREKSKLSGKPDSCKLDALEQHSYSSQWLATSQTLRVLLVEHDHTTRHNFIALLKHFNYHVVAIHDGLVAWEMIKY